MAILNKSEIMKKLVIVLLASTLAITSINAQSPVAFGLKGGLNIATLNVESDSELDPRLGLHVGGLAHIHLNRSWALQPEVIYSAQGFGDIDNDDVKWKLDYVNIPVMVQYMFDNGFRLETGPQLGLLINAKAESGNSESSLKDDLKSTDVSWGFGLNYLSKSQIGVGARYNLGLTNINEGSSDVKNRVFQISLFYVFDAAHKR